MQLKPSRAAGIVIKDNRLLLMWRRNNAKEYYVFPGGGVEPTETIEEAVIREIKEETSIDVAIKRLLYEHHYINDSSQYYYLCTYISGEPLLGDFNEKAEMTHSSDNIYKPMWVDTDKLHKLTIYPLEIRDWLIEDLQNNKFIYRTSTMEVKDLRSE